MIGVFLAVILLAAPVDSLYAVLFRTGPNWQADKPPSGQEHFQTHSRNLGRLRQDEKIVLGGRYGDVGLILVKAPTLAGAQAYFAADSSVALGVFRAEFLPWRTIFPGVIEPRSAEGGK